MTDARRTWIGLTLLVALALIAVGCGTQVVTQTVEVPVEVTREVVVTQIVEVTPAAPAGPMVEAPFEDLWASSGHADDTAEAFNHWAEDDPPVIPTSCAKCHSTAGILDFYGVDGSAAGSVEVEVGNTVPSILTCEACHNDATLNLTSVVFPSGEEVTGLGPEARCMQCHQGRQSTVSVNNAIQEAGVDEDTISEDLGFLNIHYYPAGATLYGHQAQGGYEYEGQNYDGKFNHVEGYETCVGCHNPHTLELKIQECASCHTGVESPEDIKNVRMAGSFADYDGDGDIEEGVFFELEGVRAMLLQAIQAYAAEVSGTPIVYETTSYPYYFIDTNADGSPDADEANFGNRYNAWTPRLLKAAYNYQMSVKDPGNHAHNAKYTLQLMYDSIASLNEALSSPVDLSTAERDDRGHFKGTAEAFRHWDEDDPPLIPGQCSKCHSGDGLPFFLKEGVTVSQEPVNGFLCTTCHTDFETFGRYEVTEVEFPSGAVLALDDPNANLCLQCHQGRESTDSVNSAITRAGVGDDTVSEDLGFRNIHYFAAGATLFGAESRGAYLFEGKDYLGQNKHVVQADTCIECHTAHELRVQVELCSGCHPSAADDVRSIRIDPTDWDGDGDTSEGVFGEIDTMRGLLYAALQDYAANTAGEALVYDSHSYPYFFIDTNADGVPDPDEANFGNRYSSWTPRLLRAAYNYQYSQKDPGNYAHNGKFMIQVLFDTLEDLGVPEVAGMTRP